MPEYDYKNADNKLQMNFSKKKHQEKNEQKIKLEKNKTTNIENERKCC